LIRRREFRSNLAVATPRPVASFLRDEADSLIRRADRFRLELTLPAGRFAFIYDRMRFRNDLAHTD